MWFKHLTVDDGLSHSWVLDILQDKYQFMWFATANGLNKYDGYSFEVFQHSDYDSCSIPQSIVSDIYEDSQGILWIATGDGLSKYNREKNNFKNYYPDGGFNGILGRIIHSIVEDNHKNLWIATIDGLNLYNRDTDRFTQFSYESQNLQKFSPTNLYGDMVIDKNDNLWIGSIEYGLIRFNMDSQIFTQFQINSAENENQINSSVTSLELAGEILWIGTLDNGIFKFDIGSSGGKILDHYTYDPKNPYSISNNNVISLLYISNTKIWVGTENYGLDLFNPMTDKCQHHVPNKSNPYSMNNGSIYSIYEDVSKNLWIGTYAGGVNVSFANAGDIELYRDGIGTKNVLNNNVVTDFVEDKNGNLWIGTDGGGLNYLDRENNIYTYYTSKNTNLKSDAIQSIAYDHKGNLWVSAWEGGLNRFNPKTGTFKTITTENGLPDNNVITFLIDSKNRFWVGCFFSGLVLLDNNYSIKKIFNQNNSELTQESVRALYEDSNGNILIGTDNGLFVFNPDKESFKMYLKNSYNNKSISSNQIYTMTEQEDGTFWIGTGYGLNHFDPNTDIFTHFFKDDGLPSNMIVGLVFDTNNDLWISSDRGLTKMDIHTKEFKSYSIGDGLQGNQFNINSKYRTSKNELLFGGTNGFNIFHPDSLKQNLIIPPVVLTDFQIFNTPVLIGKDKPLKKNINVVETIELSYKQSVFSFSFAALNYESSKQNQYAYKMEGFDEDWIYCGDKRSATYTNLSSGKYTFHVKASNNDGIWNETGKSVRIIINPPYWQTIWFRIIVILIILVIIATFHIGRVNNEKARNRLLEESVDERTKELKALNDELESFAFSVSHDLRAPLRTITGFSDIINQDHYDELSDNIKEYFKKISIAGTRMGQLIEDLLKLTRIGRLDMDMSRISMSTLVHEVYDNLRLSDPERTVIIKVQPDIKAFADKRLVRILLDNLIQNAWKYTRNESNPLIEFGKAKDKMVPTFYIRDNGVGFDMNFAHKLFHPFVRLHNEDEFEGTGVGLATVKRIVDRHNGQIWIESAVNKGTTVFFNFGIS